MFDDLDDPSIPSPSPELRGAVMQRAAHIRMRRRLVAGAVAAVVIAVPAALEATGSSPLRRFSVTSASDHRTTSTTVAARPDVKVTPKVRRPTTSTTWNGVLHCDTRSAAQRQQAGDKAVLSALRFGRWIVTTRSVTPSGDSYETLAVQDCSTGKGHTVASPTRTRPCATYDSIDMGADVLLYRCVYSEGDHQVVANDLTKNTVQAVSEAPDRLWRSGSMAPGGAFVVFTGAGASGGGDASTDVFVYDLGAKSLDRLPRDFGAVADRDATSAGISIDGRSVLVSSPAPATRPGATTELYLFDRLTRAYALVPTPDRLIGTGVLSGDGHHVGFSAVPPSGDSVAAYVYDAGAPGAVFVSLCGLDASAGDCAVHVSETGQTVGFTASPCVAVTGTSDRSGGIYTFDRSTGTVHKDADSASPASSGNCLTTSTTR